MLIENKEMRNLLINVLGKIDNLLNYDNKNLYKRQEHELCFCRDELEKIVRHKVEFKAGYHEWLIFIDDIAVYHFGDYIYENFDNLNELERFTDECIFKAIDDESKEDISETSFIQDLDHDTQELWRELEWAEKYRLQQQMIERLARHYL